MVELAAVGIHTIWRPEIKTSGFPWHCVWTLGSLPSISDHHRSCFASSLPLPTSCPASLLPFSSSSLSSHATLTQVCPSHPQAALSSFSPCIVLLESDWAEGGRYGHEIGKSHPPRSSASADTAPLRPPASTSGFLALRGRDLVLRDTAAFQPS